MRIFQLNARSGSGSPGLQDLIELLKNPLILATFCTSIETVLNDLFSSSDREISSLNRIQGKIIALRIRPIDVPLFIYASGKKLCLQGEVGGPPDVEISGSPGALLRNAIGGLAEKSLAPNEIEITGDTVLARQFQIFLRESGIDWKSLLSQVSPKPLQLQAQRFLEQIVEWTNSNETSFRQDVSEYLQEEARLTPTETEAHSWMSEIDVLRNSVDRLSQRILRLQGRLD